MDYLRHTVRLSMAVDVEQPWKSAEKVKFSVSRIIPSHTVLIKNNLYTFTHDGTI